MCALHLVISSFWGFSIVLYMPMPKARRVWRVIIISPPPLTCGCGLFVHNKPALFLWATRFHEGDENINLGHTYMFLGRPMYVGKKSRLHYSVRRGQAGAGVAVSKQMARSIPGSIPSRFIPLHKKNAHTPSPSIRKQFPSPRLISPDFLF